MAYVSTEGKILELITKQYTDGEIARFLLNDYTVLEGYNQIFAQAVILREIHERRSHQATIYELIEWSQGHHE